MSLTPSEYRQIRESLGLTQGQLADLLGVALNTVSRRELGQIVSDRYSLVPHTSVLEVIEAAFEGLDVGPVPRGIYMSGGGAKMRAIYKFPALERTMNINALDRKEDRLCPLIKVTN